MVDNKINDWTFHLDGVFHNVSQEEIFNGVAKNVVDRALDGYNGLFVAGNIDQSIDRFSCCLGTVMCYGQTGAGKTHTMTGFAESYPNRGIIPRALQHLFQEINNRPDFSYSVRSVKFNKESICNDVEFSLSASAIWRSTMINCVIFFAH